MSPAPTAGRAWGIRPRFVVDTMLAISFLALMSVTLTGLLVHAWWGMLISQNVLPALHLSSARAAGGLFGFWHQLHTLSASAVLILGAIHLGLNWRWVVNACKQVFGLGGGVRPRRTPDTGV